MSDEAKISTVNALQAIDFVQFYISDEHPRPSKALRFHRVHPAPLSSTSRSRSSNPDSPLSQNDSSSNFHSEVVQVPLSTAQLDLLLLPAVTPQPSSLISLYISTDQELWRGGAGGAQLPCETLKQL